MSNLILITGGVRSGKSALAESMARNRTNDVLYVATAIPFDMEMKDRIAKHRQRRPPNWDTYEGYQDLTRIFQGKNYEVIVLDCVTIMISNLILDLMDRDFEKLLGEDWDKIEAIIMNEVKEFLDEAARRAATVIMVTNEVGFGIVPENKMARVFRDIAGRINQYIASRAAEVYLVVCGLPQKIK